MKTTLRVIGVLMLLIGIVWILQGVNVLPGSFMTGQTRWAVIGGITDAVSVVLLVIAQGLGRPGGARGS